MKGKAGINIWVAVVLVTGLATTACSIASYSANESDGPTTRLEPVEQSVVRSANIAQGPVKDWKVTESKLGVDDLIDVSFSSPESGWMVGLKGDESYPKGAALYKTLDGGKTWKPLKVTLPAESYISGISFIDNSVGWRIVQTDVDSRRSISAAINIQMTRDGGETWRSSFALNKAFASKITINAKGEGWVVGMKAEASYSFDQDALALHTSNFGESWEDVSPTFHGDSKSTPSTTIPSPDYLTDVQLLETSEAWVISSTGRILRSVDRGRTWESIVQPKDEPNTLGFGILRLKQGIAPTAVSGASVNEGTWTMVSRVNAEGQIRQFRLTNIFIRDIALSENGLEVACGLKVGLNGQDKLSRNNLVIISSDQENWGTAYESSVGCGSECSLNRIVQISPGYYFAVGNRGTVVSIRREK